jgi:hypothetical protein
LTLFLRTRLSVCSLSSIRTDLALPERRLLKTSDVSHFVYVGPPEIR